MNSFKKQIEEDIAEIKDNYLSFDPKLNDDDYAFNFWILQKIYSIDEELIPDYILEDSDRGIDCYYFDEERKDLYIIQNKYYADGTVLNHGTVIDEFLTRSLEHLDKGVYKRSPELQRIFTKWKNDDDFSVYLHYYVTNNSDRYAAIKSHFEKFSYVNLGEKIRATFFSIDNIAQKYFVERIKSRANFTVDLYTMNKFTRADIDPDKMRDRTNLIRSQFMPVSVFSFFKLLQKAKAEEYPLFEENIRDFIGENSTVNKGIIRTLEDPLERDRFFYYNNGITVIADKIESEAQPTGYSEAKGVTTKYTNKTILTNPQIVNGCQTVSSIYYVLNRSDERQAFQDFSNTFVMVKLLQLSSDEDKDTYLKIVEYNNSQNAIKVKDFTAAQSLFSNLRIDLRNYGFFLMTKQSHKHEFAKLSQAEKNSMLSTAKGICDAIGIDLRLSDLKIDLVKLLQAVLSYYETGHSAYTKKSDMLKPDSATHKKVVAFLKSITREELLTIYLYFLKAEKMRKQASDKTALVPYYLLTILQRIQGGNCAVFKESAAFMTDYALAEKATKMYRVLARHKEPEYNRMIKKHMFEDEIRMAIENAKI